MRRTFGFTLIELMITMAVIAILAAVAYPSYQDHIRRGIRSQGQQYLMDLAQREEQFVLDQRQYTDVICAVVICPLGIYLPFPPDLVTKYQQPAVITLTAGPPQGFRIALTPLAASNMAADGTLIINNLQQRWRSIDPVDAVFNNGTDCRWEDSRCTPQ